VNEQGWIGQQTWHKVYWVSVVVRASCLLHGDAVLHKRSRCGWIRSPGRVTVWEGKASWRQRWFGVRRWHQNCGADGGSMARQDASVISEGYLGLMGESVGSWWGMLPNASRSIGLVSERGIRLVLAVILRPAFPAHLLIHIVHSCV
jgi:hypothetical protein